MGHVRCNILHGIALTAGQHLHAQHAQRALQRRADFACQQDINILHRQLEQNAGDLIVANLYQFLGCRNAVFLCHNQNFRALRNRMGNLAVTCHRCNFHIYLLSQNVYHILLIFLSLLYRISQSLSINNLAKRHNCKQGPPLQRGSPCKIGFRFSQTADRRESSGCSWSCQSNGWPSAAAEQMPEKHSARRCQLPGRSPSG